MSSTVQRLAPAASGLFQYFGGFAIGSVLGTAAYFYQNRETVTLGDEFVGVQTRLRWAGNSIQVGLNTN